MGEDSVLITMDTTHPTLLHRYLSDTKISCQDDPVIIKVTGASTYQWNGGTQPNNDTNNFTKPGKYILKGTNLLGCTSEIEFNIGKMYFPKTPLIVFQDSVITSSKCENYQWFRNGEILLNDTLQTLKINKGGTYFVSTNSNGCISTSEYLSTTLSIEEENISPNYSIYPNPINSTNQYLKIKGARETDELLLYTMTGQKIGLNRLDVETILTTELAAGIYVLEIVNKNTKFRTKLIKE
jgi:hypothetical protein